jgi:hypothetical protein
LLKWALFVTLSASVALCQETPLRTLVQINHAAVIYYSWFKQLPRNLQQLGPTDKAVADRNAADLLPLSVTAGIVGGYKFAFLASKTGWIITATPTTSDDNIITVYKIETSVLR